MRRACLILEPNVHLAEERGAFGSEDRTLESRFQQRPTAGGLVYINFVNMDPMSFHWCGVDIWRGGCQPRFRPRYWTTVHNCYVRMFKQIKGLCSGPKNDEKLQETFQLNYKFGERGNLYDTELDVNPISSTVPSRLNRQKDLEQKPKAEPSNPNMDKLSQNGERLHHRILHSPNRQFRFSLILDRNPWEEKSSFTLFHQLTHRGI
ncbi:hypothetical protein AVEN_204766-1 [Araneus ventricosus]|uniref:Uncharacterized protein n=1 Tax=Araneus ventricosus TaxID=182803 RepID=A0A4Y2FZ33_ARAVE|nr:hypothetical protein AVEN_204766-1 [Araneus ventricosus]